MRSFLQLLSSGLLAVGVSAGPVPARQDTHYSLSISTNGDSALNGEQLKMFNSTLGVYIENGSAVQVYDVETSDTPGLVSLHTYPVGVVDHVLVLKGKDGLYKLSDAMHDDSLDGTYYNNFKLEDGVVTQNLRGKWIAVPSRAGDWQVKWYDGSALIPQDYVPVDIVYKRLAS